MKATSATSNFPTYETCTGAEPIQFQFSAGLISRLDPYVWVQVSVLPGFIALQQRKCINDGDTKFVMKDRCDDLQLHISNTPSPKNLHSFGVLLYTVYIQEP